MVRREQTFLSLSPSTSGFSAGLAKRFSGNVLCQARNSAHHNCQGSINAVLLNILFLELFDPGKTG
eukprot:1155050-Pelagomonas_calceolata.AAC.4